MYEIEITAEGLHHLNRVPEKVWHAALESIFGPMQRVPAWFDETYHLAGSRRPLLISDLASYPVCHGGARKIHTSTGR